MPNQRLLGPLLTDMVAPSQGPACAILLCTYNGETYLPEQLASIKAQSLNDWVLHVSDDGSVDRTLEILRAFQAEQGPQRVQIHRGPGLGFARNFLDLLRRSDVKGRTFAYCDQDDIWHPKKLEQAVEALERLPSDLPALYCSTAELMNATGTVSTTQPSIHRHPEFRHALVQNLASGNTMVINIQARHLLQQVVHIDVPAHDWLTYQVVTACGGCVIADPSPSILYRQHGANLIGAHAGVGAWVRRARSFEVNRFKRWTAANLAALASLTPFMPAAQLHVMKEFQAARQSGLFARLLHIKRAGVYRRGLTGRISLWLAGALGKL